jgi:hypothetical protein
VNATGTVFSRLFVLGCALAVMAFAAQGANAGLKPEAPPHSHGGSHTVGSLHPVAPAGTSGKSSSTSMVSTHYTPPVSTYTPAVRRTAVTAAIVRATSHPLATRTQRHTAPPPKPRHRAPAQFSGWPVGLRDAAGLNELRSVASSGGSSLLFAAGFALLLLVIAEASFLGLIGSRPGVAGDRAPAKRRPTDEPYAIRPVQLRR